MDIETVLTEIGLTRWEAKCYLTLYRLQESRTGRLCKESGIPLSKIYAILERLMQKGLVSYRLQNNIKVFKAATPSSLKELIERQQSDLDKKKSSIVALIENLAKSRPDEQPWSDYKYFEGIAGIKSLWNEIEELETYADEVRIFSGVKESYEPLSAFYTEYHKNRVKKKVRAFIVFPEGDVSLSSQRKKLPFTEVRFMRMQHLAEWGVVGDMVFLQHIQGKTPRGFLIKDAIFAKTLQFAFDQLWMYAKK